MYDRDDNERKNKQRRKENPRGLNYAITANICGFGNMQSAKHHHKIFADCNVFSKANRAEEIHKIVADCGVVFRLQGAEEIHHIMVCASRNINVPEEHNDIAIDSAFVVDAAKEANGVVYGRALGNVDIAAELDGVTLGMRRSRRDRKS